jgi:hypothetical protein
MQELEQQEADEKADRLSDPVKQEEETREGVITVQGEVLLIQCDYYVVRKYTGDIVHLYLDGNTMMPETVHQEDRIEAMVNDQRQVLLIHPVY